MILDILVISRFHVQSNLFPARTLWGKVLDASKNAVVQETAVKNADEVLPHLTELDEMLNKSASELSCAGSTEISATAAKIEKTVMACRMAFDLYQVCQKSEDAGAVEKATLLETSLDKIAKTLQDVFPQPPMLKDIMDMLFADAGDLHVENGPIKLGEKEISSPTSFFQTLALEGLLFFGLS